MSCAPELFLGGNEAVAARFHVLRSRTLFGRYLGRRVSFSCFVLPDSFRAVPRASCPIFLFCAPGLVFNGSEDLVSRWHILRSRTRFGRYCGRRGSFSCFALPNSFWAEPRAPVPVFMICAPGLVSGSTVGIRYNFQVLRSRTNCWRYRGRRVPYFKFCVPGLVFGGTEGVRYRF
jgi:hypothetical protein